MIHRKIFIIEINKAIFIIGKINFKVVKLRTNQCTKAELLINVIYKPTSFVNDAINLNILQLYYINSE